MKLTPKARSENSGYRVTFKHPLENKKLVCRGLGTTSKDEADAICRDAVLIFNDPELLKDEKSPRLLIYHPRAVALVFGNEVAEDVAAKAAHPTFDESDIGTVSERVVQALSLTGIAITKALRSTVKEILCQNESQRYRELQNQFKALENEVKSLRPRCEEAEAQLQQFRKERNVHVKVRMAEAVEEWEKYYVDGRASVTIKQATSSIESFVTSLPGGKNCKLADIQPEHIDNWLQGLRKALPDGTTLKLSPVSKKRHRAYLSTFYTWAQRKYKLAANPIDATIPLAGIARNPENILAIRRESELNEFINALADYPYWQAWAAVAIFAGPRMSEQVWLKVDDVYLDEDEIRITSRASGKRIIGTKTGRERNIPIEKTVLKKILAAHVARRRAEQKKRNATPAEASQWLFPSTLAENIYRPRELTLPGLWSGGRALLDAWREVVRKASDYDAEGATGEDETNAFKAWMEKAGVWSYGPAEWRHTFGTLLGRCGWSSLEISHAMGNSPTIAERHYISRSNKKERWSFKY